MNSLGRVRHVVVRPAASRGRWLLPSAATFLGGGRRWTWDRPRYYDAQREEYQRLLTPREHFNFARDVVGHWAHNTPGREALVLTNGHSRTSLTYQTLYQEAQALATALSRPSAPRCVLVLLPKVPQWWVINVAASWCGTTVSAGTSLLREKDVLYRVQQSGADCIMCDESLADHLHRATAHLPRRVLVSQHPATRRSGWESYWDLLDSVRGQPVRACQDTRGSHVAQLFFTSGTTGRPKMVPHTQQSYGVGHITAARYWLDLTEKDTLWNISDTGWAKAAWSSLYTPFLVGATAYAHQMNKFDAEEALRALSQDGITVLCAPPTAYRAMIQCPQLTATTFPTLRHCVSAGEPLNPEVFHTWVKHTGLQIYEGYGQSESTLVSAVVPGMDMRPGTMGRAAPGYTLKVIDGEQRQVAPGQEGYLAVCLKNGPPLGLFAGYLNDEKRTQEAFVGDYYLTGDKVYMDADGYIWFVGRADDVIISSGYRIGPFEVESCLLEHPAVAESAVVSSPDSLRGEVVKAFVVLTQQYSTADREALTKQLQHHVKQSTAPYKYPRKVEFVDSLPKTVSGKIRRVELRQREWAA